MRLPPGLVATPGTVGGAVRIGGTRITTERLARMVGQGMTAQEVAWVYELTVDQVHAAVAYEGREGTVNAQRPRSDDLDGDCMVSYPCVVTGPQTANGEVEGWLPEPSLMEPMQQVELTSFVDAFMDRLMARIHPHSDTCCCPRCVSQDPVSLNELAALLWPGWSPDEYHHTPGDDDPIADIINRIDEVLQ